MKQVRTVLDNTRAPQLPEEVSHTYTDKYLLAEFLGNTAYGGIIYCLESLGLDKEGLDDLRHWARKRTVTLRFQAEERCAFERKEERKEEDPTKYVTEIERGSRSASITSKTVRTIVEYFWKYEVDYEIFAYQGNNLKKKLMLRSRHATCEIKTSTDTTPRPKIRASSPLEVNLTALLQCVSEDLHLAFVIDRTSKRCHTPRRNPNVTTALTDMYNVHNWAKSVQSFFQSTIFPAQADHELDMGAMGRCIIFNPVLPLFEADRQAVTAQGADGIVSVVDPQKPVEDTIAALRAADANIFLREQARTIQAAFASLNKTFPADRLVITQAEAHIIAVLKHCEEICERFSNGVDYIEAMLRKQLREAIGKELTPVEFSEYMTYHNRKLFREEYQPQQFCFAVRRPQANPQGVVSVDCSLKNGSVSEPIATMVRTYENVQQPMSFNLNAATKVSIYGDRYVHAWMGHQFSGESGATFELCARARQFSSYIMLIGNIVSADQFAPKHGVIVKNKDEYLLPLLFEQIPTPQAFRDAIESLSPEQQAFAKAFRGMQLESTMFAVCIIQIKPQMERLLNLPVDSLTKEIQLTEDLQDLFIQYQIPSDLVSFDPRCVPNGDSLSTRAKINMVKQHVENMQQMIKTSKERDLQEAKERTAYVAPLLSDDEDEDMPMPKMAYKKKKKGGVQPLMKRKRKASPSVASSSISSASGSKPQKNSSSVAPAPQPAKPQSADNAAPEPAPEPQHPSEQVLEEGSEASARVFDVTKLPALLDASFDKYDEDNSLHSTIIKPGNPWKKKFLKSLLSKPEETTLDLEDLRKEKNATFDLLDALTRSGNLAVNDASLHVMLAATHCFDETLVDTVIQQNVNPIEKVERSTLIVASTLHEKPASELVRPGVLERVKTASPNLFE